MDESPGESSPLVELLPATAEVEETMAAIAAEAFAATEAGVSSSESRSDSNP